MRVLYSRRDEGSLVKINAVLGASIVLPKAMASEYDGDIFDEFGSNRACQILDIYFHTVNFWRECVSAYVSQNDELMKYKVLVRLNEVIKMEVKIKELLAVAPDDYTPPVCQFISEAASTRCIGAKFKRPTGNNSHIISGKQANKCI